MLAASRLSEEYGGSMWFPGPKKISWASTPASAVASARVEQLARAREEMLGLLADLPESEHELSFSDLVVVSDQDKGDSDVVHPAEEGASVGAAASLDVAESGGRPADHKGRRQEGAAASVKQGKDGDLGASKRRRTRSGGAAAGFNELQAAMVKTNRSTCSGSVGGEGVLLNLYMPSSLTRSLTSSSRSRRFSSARERPACSIANFSEESTKKAKLNWWSSIWATKEKQHKPKVSSSLTTKTGRESSGNSNNKKKSPVS